MSVNLTRKRKELFLGLVWVILGLNWTNQTSGQTIANEATQDTSAQEDNASDILTSQTRDSKLFIERKFRFIENTVALYSAVANDSSVEFKLQTNHALDLLLTREELQALTPLGPDPLGDELRRRYSDTPSVAPISPLIAQGLKALFGKKREPRKHFSEPGLPIPKDIEIEILKGLWVLHEATPSDIYAQVDTLWPITAEDLRQVMEDMVARGFVARKKISPSHEFTLFGIARIEMSSKNRKNKVYLYWPLISKESLRKFLESKRYLALASTNHASTDGVNGMYTNSLQEKIYRLLQ
ncbi:MAG: hypothetical protein ACE5HO_09705 [bacterium]